MRINGFTVLLLVTPLLVSGCAQDRLSAVSRQDDIYSPCAGRHGFVQRISCLDAVSKTDPQLADSPAAQELLAYAAVLVQEVSAGRMSEAQANFQYQHKINSLLQQQSQISANQAAAFNAMRATMPVTTSCSGNHNNGITCTSF